MEIVVKPDGRRRFKCHALLRISEENNNKRGIARHYWLLKTQRAMGITTRKMLAVKTEAKGKTDRTQPEKWCKMVDYRNTFSRNFHFRPNYRRQDYDTSAIIQGEIRTGKTSKTNT